MRNEPMRRNDLPETCFSVLPSTGQLIIIRCGERGYYPSEWDTGKREENREIASSHNARRGITDIQEAAMLAGSMFGWNTPGANPQWYLDNARYVNSNIVQGHIKDPIMSVYYPVSSFLLCYEIMESFHFHQLRHTFTSNLLSYGAAPKDVQELLGHSDVTTTMNIYAHASKEAKRDAAKLLDKVQ